MANIRVGCFLSAFDASLTSVMFVGRGALYVRRVPNAHQSSTRAIDAHDPVIGEESR